MTRSGGCVRPLNAPVSPRGYVVAVGLAVVLGLSATGAQALEVPPVGGIGEPGEEGKRFSAFLGAFVGTDSNILRAPPGTESSDSVIELLAGVALTLGDDRSKFDLRCQRRQDSYGKLDQLNFDETKTLLGLHLVREKARFGLRAAHASLVEPVDVEMMGAGLLGRTRVACVPELDLSFGRMAVGLGYSFRSIEYDSAAYKYLGNDDTAFRAEFRWRGAETQTQQAFVHLDVGNTDYGQNVRSDFDYRRLYLGWRSETPHESGIELALGANMLRGFKSDPSLSEDAVFALVRFRSSLPQRDGRSAVELTYARGAEAAATADYKMSSRIQVRYSEGPTSRIRWSVGVSSEKDDYVNADVSASESLFWFSVDAGFQIEIGSPKGMHGRFYVTLGRETRSGDLPADEYSRLRALVGLAAVY